MADTTAMKKIAQPWVRERLRADYVQEFGAADVNLISGGVRTFEAVSQDRSIVASIRTLSGRTASGKLPSGKINDAVAELYFLSLVHAKRRLVVLTNREFHSIFTARLAGRLASGLEVRLVELPPEIEAKVREVQSKASKEMTG